MSKYPLESGTYYRVLIRASRLEKVLVDRARLQKMLTESGLTEVQWKATKTGFAVQGRYAGPTGQAQLPDRVVQVRKFTRPPPKL